MVSMRTVQMTLDERLVERVDRAARKLRKSRSAFTRDALRDALSRLATLERERQHRRGYQARPVAAGEFDDWPKEQVWPD
jgi:metal-responsive CopG/Arc/MetJ family transcriptional regulator